MDFKSSSDIEKQHQCFDPDRTKPDFPKSLVGANVLLATESLGPVNGVSRTTQSLIDYLRSNGVNVATCSPQYIGQHINTTETTHHQPGLPTQSRGQIICLSLPSNWRLMAIP